MLVENRKFSEGVLYCKLPGGHLLRMRMCEPSILNEGFSFSSSCWLRLQETGGRGGGAAHFGKKSGGQQRVDTGWSGKSPELG